MQSKDDKRAYNRIRYWQNRASMRKQQKKYWKVHYPSVKKHKSDYQKSRLKETYPKRRGYALKYKYGITYKDYLEMLKRQDGKCAICYGKNKHNYALAVDHDHKTKKIRALLCNSCNAIIGHADDQIHILEACIQYLEVN
jgi:ribosomal protein L25 (general stress protein Ctc)